MGVAAMSGESARQSAPFNPHCPEFPMIARKMFRGTARSLVAGAILFGHCAWLAAQTAGGLPPVPDYRGEIRRGPDGKLMSKL